MVLADVFATPLGLAAIAAAIPLVVLYLIQPDPRRMQLPTMQFLTDDPDEGGSNPVLERLRRNALLFLQLLAIALLAVALAGPVVTTTQATSAQPTVVVLDASASMATETGDGTRFSRAVAAAESELGRPTTLVVAGAATRVPVEADSPSAARDVLDGASVTDAPGDLRAAISRATSLAGDESRLVVVSDFAADGDWQGAVQTARATGLDVSLRQVSGGGDGNVGIVDRQFSGNRVTLSVKNTGTTAAERTLTLGDQSRSLSLQPGDVATDTYSLPADGGEARLSQGDDFPTDDVAYIATPADNTVDVLLVTNGDNRNLETALSVVETVSLTVTRPPATVDDASNYDVVVFADVDGDRLLRSTVAVARDVADDGGGVAIQAQEDVNSVGYGDLLPLRSEGVRDTAGVGDAAPHPLTRSFDFPRPDRHLTANFTGGTTLVSTADGSPLLAAADRRTGRVLYYGYLPDQTAFRYSYRYPVFWKRATNWLAERPSLSELNRRTGTTLQFAERTTVETPTGSRTAATVRLDAAGVYTTSERRASASLLSAAESNVTAPDADVAGDAGNGTVVSDPARQDLTPLAVLVVLLVVFGELGYLRYRGDI